MTTTEKLAETLRAVDLDGMAEAFHRVIEAQAQKSPFHQPINADAMIALRILRGLIPGLQALAATPAPKAIAHRRLRFFSYCPDHGIELHPTEECAEEATRRDIAHHRDVAISDGEWPSEVAHCYWGEIKGRAVEEAHGNGADYHLERIAALAATPAAPAAWRYRTLFVKDADGDDGWRVTDSLKVAEANAQPGTITPLATLAATPAAPQDEQAAFEAKMLEKGRCIDFDHRGRTYMQPGMDDAWEGWQARAALAATPAAPEAQQADPVGIVQTLSIGGTPMANSTGVEWLRPVPLGAKLYTEAQQPAQAVPLSGLQLANLLPDPHEELAEPPYSVYSYDQTMQAMRATESACAEAWGVKLAGGGEGV